MCVRELALAVVFVPAVCDEATVVLLELTLGAELELGTELALELLEPPHAVRAAAVSRAESVMMM